VTLEPDGQATGCNPVEVGSIPTGVSSSGKVLLLPRHFPQVNHVLALVASFIRGFDADSLLRLGAAHVEIVGDDARAGFEFLQLRHQPDV